MAQTDDYDQPFRVTRRTRMDTRGINNARWSPLLCVLVALTGIACQASPERTKNEADIVIGRILAPPEIKTEPGFTASVLVPPGFMYDPLQLMPRPDGTVWVNDDGGEPEGAAGTPRTGGFIWGIDQQGHVSTIVDATRMLPPTGADVAPDGFGKWGGQILTLSFPVAASQQRRSRGETAENFLVMAVDPLDFLY